MSPLLSSHRFLVVADLAVAMLYGVDEQLEEGDVELFLLVPADEVGVVEVVGHEVGIGRDVEGIVVDDESARNGLEQVLLDAALEEDLLVLAHDAEEAGQVGHEFLLAQDGDDIGVAHRLEELLIVHVVVDADDPAVVKPWILLYLLEDAEAIDARDPRNRISSSRGARISRTLSLPPIGEENRDELALGTGALEPDDLIEPRVARDNWYLSHVTSELVQLDFWSLLVPD